MDNIIHYNNNIITFNGGIIGRTLQNITISTASTSIDIGETTTGIAVPIATSPNISSSFWEIINNNSNIVTVDRIVYNSLLSLYYLEITKVGAGTCTITVQLKDPNYKPSNILTFTVNCAMATTVSTAPQSNITYTDGTAYMSTTGATAEKLNYIANLISNNSDITYETDNVYYDNYNDNEHVKFSIANQITIALNGTDYAFDIIGFNHDDLSDGSGKAGITFQMHDCFATTYQMNSSNTNTGGWKSSAMRTSTMATMKGYLPSDWQNVIKAVNKVSGTGGGSSSGTETVSDSCFLLAEVEVFGSTSCSVSGEGTQYAYYKAGNSKVKNRSGSASAWWERSPCSGNSSFFCIVFKSGGAGLLDASYSRGVAFAFCI